MKSLTRKGLWLSSTALLLFTLVTGLFFVAQSFFNPAVVHAARKQASPQTDWKPVPIVSQDALNAGFTGGEGAQWIRSIKWSQADTNFLLMSTDVGGVYRSVDGGNNWQVSMVGWNDRGGATFAMDPHNGNRVLGVGGNSLDNDGGNKVGGVYLSTDKAASWKQVLPQSVGPDWRDSIAYDPSSYNASLGYTTVAYYVSRDSGIYKTTDGGSTWNQINTGYSGLQIAVHPTKGYVYLVSNINPCCSSGASYGFYKSTDGGVTFTNKASNYTYGLAVSPAAPNDVWISRYDGVLVSTDAGETFNYAGSNTGNNGLPACCSYQIQNITVSPIDAHYLSAWADLGNYNWQRYYSTDGGQTWGTSDFGHYNSNFRQTKYELLPYNVRNGLWAYSPTTANVVISNGGDWITKSTDGGANYTYNGDGYNAIFVPTFNFNPTNANNILIASKDYNSYHSTDGGKSWSYDQTGFDFGGYGFGGFALDSNVMWLGNDPQTDSSGNPILEETTNGGQTWTNPQYNGANIVVAINSNKFDLVSYSDPTNNDIGFIGGWRTTDHGQSWAPMSGVTNVYTSDPSTHALYGGNGNDIVTSTDHGATWTTIATISDGFRELAYDQVNHRFWLATRNSLEKYENGQVSTVSIPQDQYNSTHVGAVAVDPGNPNIVYVGNNANLWTSTNAILRSTDGGQTWENLTVQTPLASGSVSGGPHEVWWIEVNPSTHEAWVVTNCFGIWKIAAPQLGRSFSTSFESGQPQPTWTNTVDSDGSAAGGMWNIGGICCGLTGPETAVRSETAHTGSAALMYSGMAEDANSSDHAYLKVFDLSGQNVVVGGNTTLTYWIYPQSSSTSSGYASGTNSTCVAVDLIFGDNTNLRTSSALDQNGHWANPAYQCGNLMLDTWNQVIVKLGTVKDGATIVRLDVGYDQPYSSGGYRGYIDDISISG